VTDCTWTLRDGSRCQSVAVIDGLCPGHFNQRRALDGENQERADRGEPPMNDRERERFLRLIRRERKATKTGRSCSAS
jgi:hypothetical protein